MPDLSAADRTGIGCKTDALQACVPLDLHRRLGDEESELPGLQARPFSLQDKRCSEGQELGNRDGAAPRRRRRVGLAKGDKQVGKVEEEIASGGTIEEPEDGY